MAMPLLLFLIFSLKLIPISILCQSISNITIGASLSAGTNNNNNSSWMSSPNGDFAFGFIKLEQDTNLFLLSIWYAKIPDKTIVWYANTDTPASNGSILELTSNGLVLTASNGEQIWKTEGLNARVSRAMLNDSGNFVLMDDNFANVWETFHNPRDTLLPTQVMQKGGKLSSRLKENDFKKGKFEFFLQDDGNLVMYSVNLPSGYVNDNYYTSGTVNSSASSAGTKLVFDMYGDMYILRENNEKHNLSEEGRVSTTQYYLRASLNFDGVFTLYQHPKNSNSSDGWSTVWSIPDNICTYGVLNQGSGVCGYNSICTLKNDKRPSCECPKWYSLIDPNDPYGSCKPDFVQGCSEDELSNNKKDLYDFEVLIDTDWPYSDYVLQKPFTEENCKQSCMEDCMCSVAIFRLGDSCWKKKMPLSNGRVDSGLNGSKAFMKVRKDSSFLLPPPTIVIKKRKTLILVGSVLFGSSAFLNLVLIGLIWLSTCYVFVYKKKLRRVNQRDYAVKTNLRCFAYEELKEATNGFDKELGRGGFGVVYEGVINIGSTTRVAVKKLNNFLLQEVEKEFKNELNVIGLTHHKNLVRVIGFCEAESERLLVFEYMSNGTLASLLFNGEKPSWKLRLQIAFGIARGLLYLHEECSTQIIHCDIKPQNILLDDYHNARISDFGLSKLLNMNQSKTNTVIRGTKGYVAPEWFKNMPITSKVDVYSFGVLLLEIISCRRNVELETENEEKEILTDWAYDCYKDGNLDALVENDKEALEDKKNFVKLVIIGIWCVQEDPSLRPSIKKVTQMLEGVVEVQVPPCPSPISIQYSLD
ncbi:hypothetical protein TanjilG_28994 [Lupinus angustifolius]|uniref:Receptor-like serine/threonine-protein kinase n=1 Tax=Lupinus angustifolius TaxID=3871 RepID=A0A4P1RSW3_LUPAN|nr:PREDICTED: G-type lectin S-receptor-like serine/threonine-protein kinase LECRK3 [Lupinus angustifolius]XP_019465353.1 PREDICTED: G-type lectin S-receptor-like serine/threonine-protein kinase LECRK3 [Lupinus angustifolius]OIW17644.1 hypothetical protein TanjilG_28994 [Lupinus angustifolius]